MDAKNRPDHPSSVYSAMCPYWDMVGTILAGAQAMRDAGKKYLPQFPHETDKDYDYRRRNAKFTNIYRDIVESLASKPFSKELSFVDGSASTSILNLSEDIDSKGNNLHVFASHLFFQGINDAISWIFVDKTPVPEGATLAVERELGARPYWVHIHAKRMLAVYSDVVDGREVFIHARIHEPEVVREGYVERTVNRVRELNRDLLPNGTYGPARFTLWEERLDDTTKKMEWFAVASGPIAIGEIALVPFIAGRRKEGTWEIVPPMQDAAYLQIEHYQQETNLKSIKEQSCFPMLSGNGVPPAVDQSGNAVVVPVGPKAVLYAPPGPTGAHGSWSYVEPSAQSLAFLSKDVEATENQLRELGRQPLTAQSGNLTVVTTAFAAQKGNTVIQAWALNLKDALEQAMTFTTAWIGADTSEPEINVHTDFSIDIESEAAPTFLLALHERKVISGKALINEAKRRDILVADFDEKADEKALLDEIPGEPSPQDLRDSIGKPRLAIDNTEGGT